MRGSRSSTGVCSATAIGTLQSLDNGTAVVFAGGRAPETLSYHLGNILPGGHAPVHATNPEDSLVRLGNTLYGVTPTGGANGYGAVFAITP